MGELLEKLKAKQQADHLKDREFAALLQISRVYWNRIKKGHRVLPGRALIQAARSYPDLKLQIHELLGLG